MIHLNRRVRVLLAGGLLVMLLMAFFLFVLSPAISRQRVLPGLIARKQSELAEMNRLKEKWNALRFSKSETEQRVAENGKNFSLLGFLEDVLKQAGLERKIQVLNPVSSMVEGPVRTEGIEVRMERVTTEELVRLLQMIETSRVPLRITRAKIQTMSEKQEKSLRITLQVHTYMPAA